MDARRSKLLVAASVATCALIATGTWVGVHAAVTDTSCECEGG